MDPADIYYPERNSAFSMPSVFAHQPRPSAAMAFRKRTDEQGPR